MSVVAEWNEAAASDLIAPFAAREGGLLPALHALQDWLGHVPAEAVTLLARAFNLSRAEVHGTISFYHDFRRHPPGRRVLRLCRAEACQSRGGGEIGAALCARLGIGWGGTTRDGALTLEPAFCLGLCAVAHAALLDGTPLGRVSADSLQEAVAEALP